MEFNLFQNNSPLKIVEKKGWKLFKFTEILEDDTKNATKVKKENYLILLIITVQLQLDLEIII